MLSFKRILSDLTLTRRESFRNKTGLFFSLVFPVILILIFGAIFSGGSSGPITVYVQNQDGSTQISNGFIDAVNSTSTIRVVLVDSSINFSQYLLSNSYSEGIVIPQGFSQNFTLGKPVNVTIYSNPADTSGAYVIGTTNGVVNAFNLRRANAIPILGIQTQAIRFQTYKYIDFLIPGLIGFTILTSPMFSMVNISAEYKKNKLFKALSLTPLTKDEWLISKITWYTILAIISFILMVGIGIAVFGAHITLSLWIIPFLVLGPLFFVSLGMLIGSVTKSIESAGVVGNIVTFPMMFLSGTFFPVSLFPTYLQVLAQVLPLFYVITGLNDVMVYRNFGGSLLDVGVLILISAIVFSLAVRLFKWRED